MTNAREIEAVDILLIEDNPTDVELTVRALKKNNVINNIHIIDDGSEALNYLFRKGKYENREVTDVPKLIILDIKLPKVSGLEILEKIKSDDVLKVIPVVVLTSSREEQDVIQSYKLGVNSYIVKPVDYNKFSESIRNLGFYWLLINQPYKEGLII